MESTQILSDEHQIILKVVEVMKRGAVAIDEGSEMDATFLHDVASFFREFADHYHHAKEEDILFPALEGLGIPVQGGPIGVMKYEHEVARTNVAKLFAFAKACASGTPPPSADVSGVLRDLAELYEQHIWKEDNVLFTMANRVLTPEADGELVARYAAAEDRVGRDVEREQKQFADRVQGLYPA